MRSDVVQSLAQEVAEAFVGAADGVGVEAEYGSVDFVGGLGIGHHGGPEGGFIEDQALGGLDG